MAMLFDVVYPGGERAIATGHHGKILVIREVPRGPECCYYDELEVDFTNAKADLPVLRVVGGPRRPTHHVRLSGTEAEIDAWQDAREQEGWETNNEPGDRSLVWVVAGRDGLDPADLARTGGVLMR